MNLLAVIGAWLAANGLLLGYLTRSARSRT
jgi:hypothetical protein